MPGLTDDYLTRLAFSVYENRGVYPLLIGSGLSRAAEISTGWEITVGLIRRVAMAQGVEGNVTNYVGTASLLFVFVRKVLESYLFDDEVLRARGVEGQGRQSQ